MEFWWLGCWAAQRLELGKRLLWFLLVLWLRLVRCGIGSGRVCCWLVALQHLVAGDAAVDVDEEVARGALWSC